MADQHPLSTEKHSVVGDMEYSHPLEKWLNYDVIRLVLRNMTRLRPGTAKPHLERALASYANRRAPLAERMAYWSIHKALDRCRGSLTPVELRKRIVEDKPTLRGIIATARSIARLGLTTPQRWLYPLFVVWNFTNKCDLNCKHCYQSSGSGAGNGEMSLDQKLHFIDQCGRNYVPMIALAGGEPTLSRHLEPVLARCKKYGIHTSLATHGGLLTPERCKRLSGCGLRYVEISLDSIHPDKHDQFRGVHGMWKQSVQGIQNVIATPGMRAGIAMCVHQDNIDEVEDMIAMAVEMGVSCFAHFNFIPVGRGEDMAQKDITPIQRERLLETLHKWLERRKIGIISTAPQFGRICLTMSGRDGLISCSHAGNASGMKARLVAKYLGGCGAGRTYACLQPNGDLTPCVYMPGRVMGNVLQKSMGEIFRNNPWWDLFCKRDERENNCGVCDYRLYCGGCRARSDAYYNRIDQADPGCIHNLLQWQQLTAQPAGTTSTVQSPAAKNLIKDYVRQTR
jgi:radical SAM protein with 4Fe4S-binding SPASM domain